MSGFGVGLRLLRLSPVTPTPIIGGVVKRTVSLFAVVALAACGADAPIPTVNHMSHAGGLMLSDLTQASQAQTLNDLRNFTAPLHDVNVALNQQYRVFVMP